MTSVAEWDLRNSGSMERDRAEEELLRRHSSRSRSNSGRPTFFVRNNSGGQPVISVKDGNNPARHVPINFEPGRGFWLKNAARETVFASTIGELLMSLGYIDAVEVPVPVDALMQLPDVDADRAPAASSLVRVQ